MRNKKNEIFIFESSSDEGVGLTPWKHVVRFRWYESTEKYLNIYEELPGES